MSNSQADDPHGFTDHYNMLLARDMNQEADNFFSQMSTMFNDQANALKPNVLQVHYDGPGADTTSRFARGSATQQDIDAAFESISMLRFLLFYYRDIFTAVTSHQGICICSLRSSGVSPWNFV
jgi:hypothetical protein